MGCINLFLNLFFLLEEKNTERMKCKGKKKDGIPNNDFFKHFRLELLVQR